MQRRILLRVGALALGVLLLAADACRAQNGGGFDLSDAPNDNPEDAYRIWVRLEYLLWQIEPAPLPSSLLKSNGQNDYFGSQDYGWLSGARLSSGLWYDYEDRIGAEASFFLFGARSQYNDFSAPAGGSLNLPFYQVVNNKAVQATNSLTGPTQSASVNFENDVRFLGGNIDFVFVPIRNSFFELNLLAGFTSVFLKEDFAQNANTRNVSAVGGTTTTTTTTGQMNDNFDAQNVFYGAEFGARGIFRYNPFFLELTGKLGIGTNYQIVDITGQTTNAVTTSPPGTTASATTGTGFLAQKSNEGSYSQNSFCLLPQFQARFGIDINANTQFFVCYDFFYLTSVVRPGNQIDQIMGTLNGTTHPAFPFNTSGFWAQGASIGLEFKF